MWLEIYNVYLIDDIEPSSFKTENKTTSATFFF